MAGERHNLRNLPEVALPHQNQARLDRPAQTVLRILDIDQPLRVELHAPDGAQISWRYPSILLGVDP